MRDFKRCKFVQKIYTAEENLCFYKFIVLRLLNEMPLRSSNTKSFCQIFLCAHCEKHILAKNFCFGKQKRKTLCLSLRSFTTLTLPQKRKRKQGFPNFRLQLWKHKWLVCCQFEITFDSDQVVDHRDWEFRSDSEVGSVQSSGNLVTVSGFFVHRIYGRTSVNKR